MPPTILSRNSTLPTISMIWPLLTACDLRRNQATDTRYHRSCYTGFIRRHDAMIWNRQQSSAVENIEMTFGNLPLQLITSSWSPRSLLSNRHLPVFVFGTVDTGKGWDCQMFPRAIGGITTCRKMRHSLSLPTVKHICMTELPHFHHGPTLSF